MVTSQKFHESHERWLCWLKRWGLGAFFATTICSTACASELDENVVNLVRRYCFDCHGADHSEAGVNLESLSNPDALSSGFRKWQLAVRQLQSGNMPPKDAAQPSDPEIRSITEGINRAIHDAADRQAGAPAQIVMRRLTSAEYAYTIADLTGQLFPSPAGRLRAGLELDLQQGFGGDAVGGTGFTNTGNAQFMQDSTLERYLDKARLVADHAVLGAGPLMFHENPGRTGLELSAIHRIQAIYSRHGFRTAAGEGGKPFGISNYPRAFFTAWRFHHRSSLGRPDVTLARLATEEKVDVRFAAYIYGVMTADNPSFPTSEVVERWQALPTPRGPRDAGAARQQCEEVAQEMRHWQDRFGTNTDAKEEAPVLREDLFDVTQSQLFEMNINWPKGTQTAHLVISIESAINKLQPDVTIVWKDPQLQFRIDDQQLEDPQPLRGRTTRGTAERLKFGVHPRAAEVGENDFVTIGGKPLAVDIPIATGARSARLLVTAVLEKPQAQDVVVRCTIAQKEETDQGKSVAGLLAIPESQAFESWKAGVLDFARALPQVSHREPAPSDRDPIPAPFDGSYNNVERNYFHSYIKYHRDDRFLVDHMLNDEDRRQLNEAWCDLLLSFEYHNLWLRFIAKKYDVELGGRTILDLEDQWMRALPNAPRRHVATLLREHRQMRATATAAQAGHLDDLVRFAALAWRRPLTSDEESKLRSFYQHLRETLDRDHRTALKTLLVRVLVAPDFLYRAERSHGEQEEPLSDWELASRLSYFLWSSLPDDELRRAAAAGELKDDPVQLAKHARRMLRDPRAKRLAAEFFGQWFGFYRFDQHRGIDSKRFPEFTESLRASMYEESLLFFDHIIRKDRPVNEILFADYAFLNQELATHYGITHKLPRNTNGFAKLNKANELHRGGLLRLGAILTTTSAPLRTSPVKRGDWVLRRILGTPVPPPPADAGSIPADDVQKDGLSIQARLEAHRRDVACLSCHVRIDPLGFALENFDPVGRWREQYRNGQTIVPKSSLRGAVQLAGDAGLHDYLVTQQHQFHQTLCTKLLGFALGRSEAIGDLPLLERMAKRIREPEHARHGISQLVEEIVTSRQFRYHGGATSNSSLPMSVP